MAAASCLGWVQEQYPIFELADRMQVELALEPEALWECVESDSLRMVDPMPRLWCDNVFKVHCSGIDAMTDLGEALAARCRAEVQSASGAVGSRHLQCVGDAAYDVFLRQGVASEGAACVELFERECLGTDSPAEQGRIGGTSPLAGPEVEDVASPSDWPAEGPPVLWRRPLGDGYSAVAHAEGQLFVSSADGESMAVLALDALSGASIWRTSLPQPVYEGQRGWGAGPRSTPVVAGGRVFVVGIEGTLVALDSADGRELWRRELWRGPHAGNRLSHGYSSTPLAWRGLLIVPTGAEQGGLMALDQPTGVETWNSEAYRNSYSSPSLVRLAGRDQVLAFMAEELVALDPGSGEELWSYAHVNQWRNNTSAPLVLGRNRLFLSSIEAGSRGLLVEPDGDGYRVTEEWRTRKMQLYHGTAAYDGKLIYGSSGATSPAFLTAVDAQTGELVWRSRDFAKANVSRFGDRLLILDEDGVLALVESGPAGPKILSRFQLFDGRSWTAPTVIGDTLYVRDTREIVALDLSVESKS